jgi:hypothetical protein
MKRVQAKTGVVKAIAVAALTWGASFAAGSAQAAIIFQDHFDTEAAGTTNNYASFVHWDVLNGTVDLIVQGSGLGCLGVAGKCVDMDGSSGDAGDLRSKLVIGPGTYQFEFWISGNQRGVAPDSMTVTFGDLNETFFRTWEAPYSQVVRTVTVGGGGDRILFSHASGDNVGIMLDSVIVRDAVAVPAIDTRHLLLGGLGLLALIIAPQRLATLRDRRRHHRRLSGHL